MSYAGFPPAARPGETAGTLRLLAYLALAVALLVLDRRGDWLERAREQATVLVQPLWALAGLPGRAGNAMKDGLAARQALLEENRRLRNELLVADARLTRLRNAAVDNAQLRELLGVAERTGLDVQLVPILDIDLAPSRQRLVLGAGSRQGVYRGQAVIDAGGLLGQVVAVTPANATVLLLTDPDHAVPVMVARNGVRLIVYGRGDRLELRDVALNQDVQVGDDLVTSGLGGRFPPGFPVATIAGLHPDEGQAFLVGELKPAAQLDRGRDVLLLRGREPDEALPGADPDAAAGAVDRASGASTTAPAPQAAPAAPEPAR
ncbi:rod shape-determining protein MreC [Pseudoxanthomonas broegbernensis]|uniref:Cell shape-determining protein MreC n=1 Tax=Pseudoxanthomonas broegbernensis TaxID=83619 RepID=A0A7V8K6K2_9GAMM|nr:rod shape-determining protein MreC [Pseudoxanthomonas broegbernensis]MBB6066156.1 rod shape-determining protein MreC [Pseudoxanthomonas broegbernensis]